MNKVILLDRDGTINKEVNYLYKPEDFVFISGVVEAIKIFKRLGYKVIVITNQSGIARGYYKEEDVKKLHRHIDNLLAAEGTGIDGYYYCPHHPEGILMEYKGECSCRKPKTGMIIKASNDFDINIRDSIIIGDKEIDMLTGKNSCIGKCILVRSGNTTEEKITVADAIYDKLYDYAKTL